MSGRGVTAFVGLGSNLDEPAAQVRRAIDRLAAIPGCRLEASSSLYASPPMGPSNQPDYVNAVVRVDTMLTARELLGALQRVEREQGRVRDGTRWGPRTIDLDLLLYGEQSIDEPGLTVPHPGISERAFVLVPLAELAPGLEIPGHGSVDALLTRIDAAGLSRLPCREDRITRSKP